MFSWPKTQKLNLVKSIVVSALKTYIKTGYLKRSQK